MEEFPLLEPYLIEFCAPTLASLKVGSLFCYQFSSQETLARQVAQVRRQLQGTGVCLSLLRVRGDRALTYLWRRSQLENVLLEPEIQHFLQAYGYLASDPLEAISRLRQRIATTDSFPHEIGVFLGYPLEDVQGFICNRGQNCKCTGCWKVYGDAQSAQKKFAQYKKCHRIYKRRWQEGSSLRKLTVAV
jgi:hypothetical protein